MKGIIFRSFIDFSENKFGLEFVDKMITSLSLVSNGVYTNVGKYPYTELISYFNYIYKNKNIKPETIAKEFGSTSFKTVIKSGNYLETSYSNCFECLQHLEKDINKQVKKLYIDAKLPGLSTVLSNNDQTLTLNYSSSRPFTHLWHGIIIGCINYFKEDISLDMKDISSQQEYKAIFILQKQ